MHLNKYKFNNNKHVLQSLNVLFYLPSIPISYNILICFGFSPYTSSNFFAAINIIIILI